MATSITIMRYSERGRPIAAPVARALSLEEELEADIEAFAQTRARAETYLAHTATGVLVASFGSFASYVALTLSLFSAIWLATRLATGV